ncbi:hypothetical protein LJR153_001080 [Paenibacillus sp. LjRoot153]|uniref:hypothetical protein n=1 Tax=Paenibacillus sp. LjRoot153 TaxID=3342270 RepID=UPI003ED10CDE
MKKTYLIILLVFALVFIGYKYTDAVKSSKQLQSSIDKNFKSQLSNISSSLSMKVDETSYRIILTSVSNAAAMSVLTSYENLNDNLDISLYNLYISLREEKSKNKVLARTDELREIFMKLVNEPSNKDALVSLMKFTDETFFHVKE